MEQIEKSIRLYHQLYVIFVSASVFSLLLTIAIYKYLKIKTSILFLWKKFFHKNNVKRTEKKFYLEREILVTHTREKIE